MSKHIITKSKMIVDGYVDAAGIGRRLFILPGEKLLVYLNYADDFSIYCKSNHAARKTGNKVFLFLKDKLKLPHQPRENKLKQSLKTITCKTSPLNVAERIHKLKEVGRGWLNYFRMASITGKLRDLDSWVRNRLRYCIWHNWKKPERKRKNLIRLGVDYRHAYAWSRTRMGGWAVAQSEGTGNNCYFGKTKEARIGTNARTLPKSISTT